MENILEVKSLSKTYSDEAGYRIELFRSLNFKAEKNSFTSIVAPTGSGKSSLLKILAGLEEPSEGTINTNNAKVVFIPSQPSSFPWMNVKDNILFANESLNDNEVDEIVKLVGLEGYALHTPHNNSYGFRFRIALARALAVKAGIILLDEPFTQLDAQTRKDIYALCREVNTKTEAAFLLATTNITEAALLSGKIFLMKKNPGEIIEEMDISFTAERNSGLLSSEEFMNLRRQIENRFKTNRTQQMFNFSI